MYQTSGMECFRLECIDPCTSLRQKTTSETIVSGEHKITFSQFIFNGNNNREPNIWDKFMYSSKNGNSIENFVANFLLLSSNFSLWLDD